MQSILGLDNARLLPLLQRNITNQTLGLSLLSELELCSVRPPIIRSYESRGNIEAAQWLHHQYRRYAVWIKEFEEGQKQYSIPLLDLTVVVGTDPLLFEQRNREDASKLLPPALSSRRFVFFPQTRFAFIEDEVEPSVMIPTKELGLTCSTRSSNPYSPSMKSNSGSCHPSYSHISEGLQGFTMPSQAHLLTASPNLRTTGRSFAISPRCIQWSTLKA